MIRKHTIFEHRALNTSRPEQNAFTDSILQCFFVTGFCNFFVNENACIFIQFSKLVTMYLIKKNSFLVQVMACHRTGHKLLLESILKNYHRVAMKWILTKIILFFHSLRQCALTTASDVLKFVMVVLFAHILYQMTRSDSQPSYKTMVVFIKRRIH